MRARIFTGAFLTACAATSAPAIEAKVERLPGGEVQVSWESAVPELVDVFVYGMVDGKLTSPRLVSEGDRDGKHSFSAGNQRPYLLLQTESGAKLRVAERVLALEGGQNFRDLGGYRTVDGRRVRWGMLFRSGTMHGLTSRDYAVLGQLGIRVSCDFRTTDERAKEPTRWAGTSPPRRIEHDYALDNARELGDPALTADRARTILTRLYADLPFRLAPVYREMFGALRQGDVPLAFNCSAGKDRTGIAAALLLTALGVPRETIVEDYLLSNAYYQPHRHATSPDDANSRWMEALPEDVRSVVMGVERRYLDASFAAIESRYGSVDAYLVHEMRLDAHGRARLRALLTETY
jgi:protein-tyrosine phosphatase